MSAHIAAGLIALDALIAAAQAHRSELERTGSYTTATLRTRIDMGKAAMAVWDDGEIAPDIENCEWDARPFSREDDGWKDADFPSLCDAYEGARHPLQSVALMGGDA